MALKVEICLFNMLFRYSSLNDVNQTQGKTIDAAKNTLMLLQETKQVALNTTETLANQTNQIGNMKGDVEEIDNKLKRSEQVILVCSIDQLIRTYLVRMMTDKIIMGLIFVLVVLIVVAVILYSIFGKKEDTTCIDVDLK